MFCQKCEKKLSENAKFCSACGARLKSENIANSIHTKLSKNKKLFRILHIIISTLMIVVVISGLISFAIIGESDNGLGGLYTSIPKYFTLSDFLIPFLIISIPFVYFFLVYRKINKEGYIYKLSIFVIAVILINIVWISWQDIKYKDDVKKMKTLRPKMVELNNKINSKKMISDKYISQREVNEYNKSVDEFNSLIPEFNEIIKNSGSRSYFIPIPLFMGSRKLIK